MACRVQCSTERLVKVSATSHKCGSDHKTQMKFTLSEQMIEEKVFSGLQFPEMTFIVGKAINFVSLQC